MRLSTKKPLFAVLFSLWGLIGVPVLAQGQDDLPEYTQYGHQVAYCAWSGGVMAWAPAIVLECALPGQGETPDFAALQARAMAQCEAELSKTPDIVKNNVSCTLGWDGEALVDDRLKSLVFDGLPFDVTVTSKEARDAATQTGEGQFQEAPWPYNDEGRVAFWVFREGGIFCQGEYWMALGLKVEAVCEGKTYRGTTFARSILKRDGMYFWGPKRVKVRSKGGAFVELDFVTVQD